MSSPALVIRPRDTGGRDHQSHLGMGPRLRGEVGERAERDRGRVRRSAAARQAAILVLRQEGELELEQQEFLERATGGWEGGALYGTFRDASDVGLAVVRGLTNIRDRGARATLEPAAQDRAAAFAADARRQGGSIVRVVLVPLVDQPLLQAAALEDRNLPEELAAAARAARLVQQSEGIATNVSAGGSSCTSASSTPGGRSRSARTARSWSRRRSEATTATSAPCGSSPSG